MTTGYRRYIYIHPLNGRMPQRFKEARAIDIERLVSIREIYGTSIPYWNIGMRSGGGGGGEITGLCAQ